MKQQRLPSMPSCQPGVSHRLLPVVQQHHVLISHACRSLPWHQHACDMSAFCLASARLLPVYCQLAWRFACGDDENALAMPAILPVAFLPPSCRFLAAFLLFGLQPSCRARSDDVALPDCCQRALSACIAWAVAASYNRGASRAATCSYERIIGGI